MPGWAASTRLRSRAPADSAQPDRRQSSCCRPTTISSGVSPGGLPSPRQRAPRASLLLSGTQACGLLSYQRQQPMPCATLSGFLAQGCHSCCWPQRTTAGGNCRCHPKTSGLAASGAPPFPCPAYAQLSRAPLWWELVAAVSPYASRDLSCERTRSGGACTSLSAAKEVWPSVLGHGASSSVLSAEKPVSWLGKEGPPRRPLLSPWIYQAELERHSIAKGLPVAALEAQNGQPPCRANQEREKKALCPRLQPSEAPAPEDAWPWTSHAHPKRGAPQQLPPPPCQPGILLPPHQPGTVMNCSYAAKGEQLPLDVILSNSLPFCCSAL